MSSFDGIVEEFPDIRIDYFRQHQHRTQPAACFLSHIHSDHLLGLETLRMPFVYCSAATKRMLLKMEKYPHRIDFSKGILESRKQTYKHLKLILRPLPLETATEIELRPDRRIRVTLFDANHCPGAVMFLIEDDARAILYTGDIRAEPWWVNALVRTPAMIPYTAGHRQLDCIYLDTTFASHADIHKHFPTKAEGLAELLAKISESPKDAIFYFRAWTLGYEDVWKLLSNFLDSQVHVDQYQVRLFSAVAEDGLGADIAPSLVGFPLGNTTQSGCLTTSSTARIHSCEPGTTCHMALRQNKNVVWISPIISRMDDGTEVAEIGTGEGDGDLYKQSYPESTTILDSLRALCAQLATDPESISCLEHALRSIQKSNLQIHDLGLDPDGSITIKDFIQDLIKQDKRQEDVREYMRANADVVRFPYSRHSSYSELRHLVEQFKPNDICPCTVDLENWNEGLSMAALFGDLCSGNIFIYDKQMWEQVVKRQNSTTTATASQLDSQRTRTESLASQEERPAGIPSNLNLHKANATRQTLDKSHLPHLESATSLQPGPSRPNPIESAQGQAGPSRTRPLHHALQSALETQSSGYDDPKYAAFMARPIPTESQNIRIRLTLQRQWRELNDGHDTLQDSAVQSSARLQSQSQHLPPFHIQPQHQIYIPDDRVIDVTRPDDPVTVKRRLFITTRDPAKAHDIEMGKWSPEIGPPEYNPGSHSSISQSFNHVPRKRQHSFEQDLEAHQARGKKQKDDVEADVDEIRPERIQANGLDGAYDSCGIVTLESTQSELEVDLFSKVNFMTEQDNSSAWLTIDNLNQRQHEAYLAAKRCLQDGDTRDWLALGIWSVGYHGHSREEVEL